MLAPTVYTPQYFVLPATERMIGVGDTEYFCPIVAIGCS